MPKSNRHSNFVAKFKNQRYDFYKSSDTKYTVIEAVFQNAGWGYIVTKNDEGDWKLKAFSVDKVFESWVDTRIKHYEEAQKS